MTSTLGRTATVAVLLMLGANLMFTFTDVSSKWLAITGYAALQMAFFRYLTQFVITSALLARRGTSQLRAAKSLIPKLMLRGSFLIASTVLNFLALKTLSLSVTSAIMFSAPVVICALSWPLLGERVGPVRWAAVALGFLGVLIVIRPFSADVNAAAFFSLGAAVGIALYSIMTRKMANDADPLTMQFVLGVTGTLALAPFAWMVWVPLQTASHFVLLASLGGFAWFGHEMFIKAHQSAEANFLSPFAYSYLIYMTLGGYVVFGTLPDIWTVVGAVTITFAGLLIWWRELRLTREVKPAS